MVKSVADAVEAASSTGRTRAEKVRILIGISLAVAWYGGWRRGPTATRVAGQAGSWAGPGGDAALAAALQLGEDQLGDGLERVEHPHAGGGHRLELRDAARVHEPLQLLDGRHV